jgi:hypothetical protein
MTKTTIALAAALLMGTATAALADSAKRHSTSTAKGAMKSTPVRGDQDRNMSMMPNSNLMMNVMDRASSPFACGG